MLYLDKNIEDKVGKYMPIVLVILWCLMQLLVGYTHGVKVAFDSRRYLEEAQSLSFSSLSDIRLSYLSYSLFLKFVLALTDSLEMVVAVQVLIGSMATIAFYRLAQVLYKNQITACAATTLLIGWAYFQHWHFYIHTESLFASFIIFILLRLVTAQTHWHYLQLILLLLFVTFMRANGFMVVLAVISYFVVDISMRRKYNLAWVAVVLVLVLMPLLVLLANTFLDDMAGIHSFTGQLTSGTVLQGYKPMSVAGAERINLSGSPLQQVWQLLMQETSFFLEQSLLRVMWYWGQVRPYYSTMHNWFTVLYMYPLYLLMLWNIWKQLTPKPVLATILALAILFTAMVVVSGVDWDNRFMMPLIPWVVLLGASGGINFFSQFIRINQQQAQ